MSLINEALKRAKEAQQSPSATTAGFPQLRAVERAGMSPSSGLLPAITLALVAMLALVVIWQWIHPRRISNVPSVARTAEISPVIAHPATPAKAVPTQIKPPPVPQAKPATPQAARSAPAKTVIPPQVTTPPMAPPMAPPPTSAAKPATTPNVAPAEPAPKPIQLNVQAIVFNPTRPSALINGRTLFLGDHISDFRVAAISPKTVTVVKPGKTNVLVLRD